MTECIIAENALNWDGLASGTKSACFKSYLEAEEIVWESFIFCCYRILETASWWGDVSLESFGALGANPQSSGYLARTLQSPPKVCRLVGKDNFSLARANPQDPKGRGMKSRKGESWTGIRSKALRKLSHLDLQSGHVIFGGTPDQLKLRDCSSLSSTLNWLIYTLLT